MTNLSVWRLRLCDPESVDIELLFANEADARATLAAIEALPFVVDPEGGHGHRDFTLNGNWTIGQTDARWHNWSLCEIQILQSPADVAESSHG